MRPPPAPPAHPTHPAPPGARPGDGLRQRRRGCRRHCRHSRRHRSCRCTLPLRRSGVPSAAGAREKGARARRRRRLATPRVPGRPTTPTEAFAQAVGRWMHLPAMRGRREGDTHDGRRLRLPPRGRDGAGAVGAAAATTAASAQRGGSRRGRGHWRRRRFEAAVGEGGAACRWRSRVAHPTRFSSANDPRVGRRMVGRASGRAGGRGWAPVTLRSLGRKGRGGVGAVALVLHDDAPD